MKWNAVNSPVGAMRVPRLKFAVRRLMAMVAAIGVILVGPIDVLRYKLRERALVCHSVVGQSKANGRT
jgi:hypothetical protein